MSDGIMLSIGDDGIARAYDDTWDITIHCESKEEQEEARKALESIPRWIPCSERLPETTGEYLVTKREMYTHRLIIDIAMYFVNDGWHKADPVIAWMPLPEPYQPNNK